MCLTTPHAGPAGSPVAWKLMPQAAPLLLAKPDSAIAKRGAFAQKNLWVTPHSDQVRSLTEVLQHPHRKPSDRAPRLFQAVYLRAAGSTRVVRRVALTPL